MNFFNKHNKNDTNSKETNNSNSFQSYFQKYTANFSSLIKNEIKVSPEERYRNLKALILTIIIISILLFIFWKVPFLHNWLFP